MTWFQHQQKQLHQQSPGPLDHASRVHSHKHAHMHKHRWPVQTETASSAAAENKLQAGIGCCCSGSSSSGRNSIVSSLAIRPSVLKSSRPSFRPSSRSISDHLYFMHLTVRSPTLHPSYHPSYGRVTCSSTLHILPYVCKSVRSLFRPFVHLSVRPVPIPRTDGSPARPPDRPSSSLSVCLVRPSANSTVHPSVRPSVGCIQFFNCVCKRVFLFVDWNWTFCTRF